MRVILENSHWSKVKWFTCNNSRYNKRIFILHDNILFEICEILIINDEINFMCSEYNIVGFDEFLNSYEIRKSSETDYVSISFYALVNKKPFDKKMIGNNSYILAETLILVTAFKQKDNNTNL